MDCHYLLHKQEVEFRIHSVAHIQVFSQGQTILHVCLVLIIEKLKEQGSTYCYCVIFICCIVTEILM